MINDLYVAVDLGAGSGRVFISEISPDEFMLEEIRRFHYPPQMKNGHLRWDFALIFEEIKHGLRQAGERARQLNRLIKSIGVDSWAVDYGLIDNSGNLTDDPISYRDYRTENAMREVFEKVPRRKIFEKTGIQFLEFNTIFQLFVEGANLKKVQNFLLLPDLINYFLTGKSFTEYTNATTTQLVNAETRDWDDELIAKLNLPESIFPKIIPAGTNLGLLKAEIAEDLNLQSVSVIAPATHDTASAVIGAPLEENWAFISSGTWSLVGIERDKVLINPEVAEQNFTNEGGAYHTIRFLKNVMGLWILESCRREWESLGLDTDYENLLREVSKINDFQGFIFPDDKRFLNPPQMLQAIENQLAETGQEFDRHPACVTKIILDSLAFRYASILNSIENLNRQKLRGVQIVGGGGRNEYLNQMTANACQLPVKAGLSEATVTGNILIQAISAGRFHNLKEARNYVAEKVKLKIFSPVKSESLEKAKMRYAEIEALYQQI